VSAVDRPPTGPSREARSVVIVPCFNEELRIDEYAYLDLVGSGRVRLIFVNDGSTDGTGRLLEQLSQKSEMIDVLDLSHNQGKAEAVRLGLLRAVDEGRSWSAISMRTSPLRVPNCCGCSPLSRNGPSSRPCSDRAWPASAADIERSSFGTITGRVFATLASLALGVAVYDTQCGAKVFRVNANFTAAIEIALFGHSGRSTCCLCQRMFDGTAELAGITDHVVPRGPPRRRGATSADRRSGCSGQPGCPLGRRRHRESFAVRITRRTARRQHQGKCSEILRSRADRTSSRATHGSRIDRANLTEEEQVANELSDVTSAIKPRWKCRGAHAPVSKRIVDRLILEARQRRHSRRLRLPVVAYLWLVQHYTRQRDHQ
jgi:hypothetical protein